MAMRISKETLAEMRQNAIDLGRQPRFAILKSWESTPTLIRGNMDPMSYRSIVKARCCLPYGVIFWMDEYWLCRAGNDGPWYFIDLETKSLIHEGNKFDDICAHYGITSEDLQCLTTK